MGKHSIEELKTMLKQAEDAGAETVEIEEEGKPEEANTASVNVDLAESIAEKIADAVVKANGGNQRDKENIQYDTITAIKSDNGIAYPSNLKSLTKDERIVTFFKALVRSHDDIASAQVVKALVEGTDSDGGYLVPDELRSEVWRILPDFSVMRRIARTIPMASDTMLLNSLTATPEAYWTNEYASKATTSADFSQVTLNANKLVCLLPITEELLTDANISLVQFITEIFAERIGTIEDRAYFTGSGTGQPKGITQESLSSRDAGGTLDFDDVIALLDLVPQRVAQSNGAAFVGHRNVKRTLRTVKDTNGMYIWRDGGAANNGETRRLPDTLYGYPFYEQNDLPHNQVFFGDWKYYIIGDRQSLTVRTTMEGGDAWRRDSMEIKAKIRVDGKVVMAQPFAKVTNA